MNFTICVGLLSKRCWLHFLPHHPDFALGGKCCFLVSLAMKCAVIKRSVCRMFPDQLAAFYSAQCGFTAHCFGSLCKQSGKMPCCQRPISCSPAPFCSHGPMTTAPRFSAWRNTAGSVEFSASVWIFLSVLLAVSPSPIVSHPRGFIWNRTLIASASAWSNA